MLRHSILLLAAAFTLAAQEFSITKKVEPDYRADANQPSLTLPIAVRFVVYPDGTPFSIASLDGPLDDAVVDALSQYRFTPTKTGMAMLTTVPIRMPVSRFSVNEQTAQAPDAAETEVARKLTWEAAQKLERDLPKKDSLLSRSILLAYAATHSEPGVAAMRVRQLEWLVRNEPRAGLLRNSTAIIPKSEDAAGYAAIRALWMEAIKSAPLDKDVVHGAVNFLMLQDPQEVVDLLSPYASSILHRMEWLGETYGLVAIGATLVPQSDAFVSKARTALLQGALPLSMAGYSAITAATKSARPAGYEEFCTQLADKIRATKPGFLDTCKPTDPMAAVGLSGGVSRGMLKRQDRPNYPASAKERGIQGTVLLGAIIGRDGKVADLRLISGPLALVPESKRAVSKWIYSPYYLNGEAVEVLTEIEVNYQIR